MNNKSFLVCIHTHTHTHTHIYIYMVGNGAVCSIFFDLFFFGCYNVFQPEEGFDC